MTHARLRVSEIFGLSPLETRIKEAALLFRGDATTPKTLWDHTSLRQMTRVSGPRLWAGQRIAGRRVPISNLYSYVRPPPEQGWSVRVTTARDFMGGQLTYDSHNGTDFATPIGTRVVAAAPGTVRRISSEFNRGGLKIFIDHGEGLVTTSNHLGRALVRVGDEVRRGQTIALSGYSGLDGLFTFPWGIPHVHFNVWLNGEYTDPFAAEGATPLWRTGNWPEPYRGSEEAAAREPVTKATWDERALARALDACISEASRADIVAHRDPEERAMATLFHLNYYPTRFRERPSLYASRAARTPRLDLPFSAYDYDGVTFPGERQPPPA